MIPQTAVKIVCEACSGTGLYSGFGEQSGTAVVCSSCNGTGGKTFFYTPFKLRKIRKNITKVFERNNGYVLGEASKGGLTYNEWASGMSFFGREERDTVCPHLHNQRFEVEGCKDVALGQRIDTCPQFKNKSRCWAEYDKRKGI